MIFNNNNKTKVNDSFILPKSERFSNNFNRSLFRIRKPPFTIVQKNPVSKSIGNVTNGLILVFQIHTEKKTKRAVI
jgi:hypothetical protein